MKQSEKSRAGLYFLLIVITFYILAWLLRTEAVLPSLEFSLNIAKSIIPVFALVFSIMVFVNHFIKPGLIAKYLGRTAGVKRWIFAIVFGIVSTGPIYMWYPMLRELKDKGANYGFVAAFLYNRAIKPPLIPLIIFYFGLEFTLVLTTVMIIFSVIQGLIFEKFEEVIS